MGKFNSSSVWDNLCGVDEISDNAFNFLLGLTTIFGIAVYGVVGMATMTWQPTWWSTLGMFLVALLGVFVTRADAAPIKFFGLALIAGGLGAILGPVLAHYKVASIVNIAFATAIITCVLGFAGTVYPRSLESWGGILFTILGALIVAQFGTIIAAVIGLPMKAAFTFLDWIGVLLFSGYIVFDFNRSQHVGKTVENAVDCGVAIFLDIANLFVNLLAIFGVADDD